MQQRADLREKQKFPKSSVPAYPPSDISLQLVERVRETGDIVSFRFTVKRPDGKEFRHHPGQAVALMIPVPGEAVSRVFTIAASDTSSITLTIKAHQGGNLTRFMHDSLEVGDELHGRGPFGRFSLVYHSHAPLLLIGAGSGITPMMAMFRWLAGRRENTDIAFVQQARRESDLLFTEEIAQLAQNLPNLQCFASTTADQHIDGSGRFDRAKLCKMVPDLGRRTVFCCGPSGFMNNIRAIYLAEGGAADCFHLESFGGATEQSPVLSDLNEDETSYQVTLDGKSFKTRSSQKLSDAASRNGLQLPTACRQGICGTCKVRLVSGNVKMRHQGGLSRAEEEEGFILACSSTALSDLAIEKVRSQS